ncbi:hypothetical protein ACN9JF_08515 [Pseudoalteromonas lipolytica]|uniref:hypothetical protein n=2 Tax=Pseudoalteromonas TaxID=53246 RepID=UPI003BA2C8C5
MSYLKMLVLFLVIVVGLVFMSGQSAKQQLLMTLADQLPKVVNPSLNNAIDESHELLRMSHSLAQDMNEITFVSQLPINLVESLTVTKLNLSKIELLGSNTLSWQFGNHRLYASIASSIKFRFWLVVICASILTALGVLIDYLLSLFVKHKINANNIAAYDETRTAAIEEIKAITEPSWFDDLKHQGLINELTAQQALQLESLPAQQRCWLSIALKQGLTMSNALQAAEADDELCFDLVNQQVIIHGVPIRISKTPLLYYFWYAKRKFEGEPAYLNPPQAKPDQKSGQVLAKLMLQYSGHQKAIRDLDGGLKSKTLDQNRNKIKTELQRVLDDLACDYLFDCERDERTARYRYSLKLSASQLKFIS